MYGKEKINKNCFNKEEIINLNDFEMSNTKGGTSLPCLAVSMTVILETHEDSFFWLCDLTHTNCAYGGYSCEPNPTSAGGGGSGSGGHGW